MKTTYDALTQSYANALKIGSAGQIVKNKCRNLKDFFVFSAIIGLLLSYLPISAGLFHIQINLFGVSLVRQSVENEKEGNTKDLLLRVYISSSSLILAFFAYNLILSKTIPKLFDYFTTSDFNDLQILKLLESTNLELSYIEQYELTAEELDILVQIQSLVSCLQPNCKSPNYGGMILMQGSIDRIVDKLTESAEKRRLEEFNNQILTSSEN